MHRPAVFRYDGGFLHEETQSWAGATARYHSGHPTRGRAYREKVFRLWDEVLEGPPGERRPIRLAGSPLTVAPGAEAIETAEPTRLIVPGAGRTGARGGLRVLRGN